jgi:probable DNA metabolism protein
VIAAAAHDFGSWREDARRLLGADVRPEDVQWNGGLFAETVVSPSAARVTIPREFLSIAEHISLHRDEHRWALLYRVLWRLTHGERNLLRIAVDDDVRELQLMAGAVGRDMHKMTAFVRFRRVQSDDGERFVAWYVPDHHIVEPMAPWFLERFGGMRWSILTPDRSAHWDLQELSFGPGVPRSAAPDGDALEDLWRDYYAAIFNPARVNVKAMTAEMPSRHWATLPEAELIPRLLSSAGARVMEMAGKQKASAAQWVPRGGDLNVLRAAAAKCRGCELYSRATQAVFGEGPPDARVVMVGEQPGDEEDERGRPFVGPAGRLLDEAMLEAGLDRQQVYVTNAVKHFKWEERGKRRIHSKPSGIEISACRPWLEAELDLIRPELIVCLGATAAQALMGREFRIRSERGQFFPHSRAKELVATIHPSAILRAQERCEEEYALFVRDLRLVADRMRAFQSRGQS